MWLHCNMKKFGNWNWNDSIGNHFIGFQMWIHLQSLDEFGWKTIARIALLICAAHTRLHHQTVLNVYVEWVLCQCRTFFVRWKQLQNYVRKKWRIATRILNNGVDQRIIVLVQVIQIDTKHHLKFDFHIWNILLPSDQPYNEHLLALDGQYLSIECCTWRISHHFRWSHKIPSRMPWWFLRRRKMHKLVFIAVQSKHRLRNELNVSKKWNKQNARNVNLCSKYLCLVRSLGRPWFTIKQN